MEGIVTTIVSSLSAVIVAYIVNVMAKKQGDNHDETMEALKQLRSECAATRRIAVTNARSNIALVYEKYKNVKEIDNMLMQDVQDLYDAYKSTTVEGHTPNSWCDEVVAEMKTWKKH